MAKNKQCCLCGEPAVVHVAYVASGKLHGMHYCEKHAHEAGVFDHGAYGLISDKGVDATVEQGPSCPACGYTRKLWRHTGRLGCPVCYETFGEDIAPVLSKMHRGVTHVGRVPRSRISPAWIDHRLKHLSQQLSAAIREERYEDAAETRDEMLSLKNTLS